MEVAPLHRFTIHNKNRVVMNGSLKIPFKNLKPSWKYIPFGFLPHIKPLYAVIIGAEGPKGRKYKSYSDAATFCDVSVDQIKNNLRGRNTVVKGKRYDKERYGEETYYSFLTMEQNTEFATNKEAREAWYKERQEIVVAKRQRKTRSDVGKKHKMMIDQIERDKMIMSLFIQANRKKLDELKETQKAA